ncbi:hypothetical protein V5799_031693 [Amblyomma americanum]|uniref:Uncharacterized protein n=1 Tax=Amblyomma americanum TaxID=6943 RepID=A0AAQ4DTA8_AMBAM
MIQQHPLTSKIDSSNDAEKKRTALRTQTTCLVGEVKALLKSTAANAEDLVVLIERLQLTYGELNNADTVIEPLISEQEADAEFATIIKHGD